MPEKLFLTGSEELQRTWQVYGLSDFYRQLAIKEGTTQLSDAILNGYERRLNKVQKVIDEYTASGWYKQETLEEVPKLHSSSVNLDDKDSLDSDEEIKKLFSDPKITAKDIVLTPYLNEPVPRNQVFSRMIDKLNSDQIGFDAYLSTPLFIKRLTQISDELITQPNQQQYLRSKLREVNQQLPGAVYLPFVSCSMRNFAILHIVADESRIFRTKERAPVMLCFEVYRPIELSLESKPAIIDINKRDPILIVQADSIEFDPTKKREHSRSTVVRQTTEETFYPFESMDSQKLKEAITTSKDLKASGRSTKKTKEEVKQLKDDNERFSKVRRMTNKDQQRQEFEQMADNKASKAIQINYFNNTSTALRNTQQNERAPSISKQLSKLELNENYFLTSQRIKTQQLAGVVQEETKQGTADDKSVYYSYRDNYMTYRSNSNPDIE